MSSFIPSPRLFRLPDRVGPTAFFILTKMRLSFQYRLSEPKTARQQ
jgi:hypothetical protein